MTSAAKAARRADIVDRLEAEIERLRALPHTGQPQLDRRREEVRANLRRLGYEPSDEQFADSAEALKRRSAQYRLRDKVEKPRSMDEVLWAVIEALVIQGGIEAWPGDGTSCVAQMIWAQHERAERLRVALTEILADLDDPDLIEISAATIARARQAVVNIQQSSGEHRD